MLHIGGTMTIMLPAPPSFLRLFGHALSLFWDCANFYGRHAAAAATVVLQGEEKRMSFLISTCAAMSKTFLLTAYFHISFR